MLEYSHVDSTMRAIEMTVKKSISTPRNISEQTEVNTISRALANVFTIELSDFKKTLVTKPAAALFAMIRVTLALSRWLMLDTDTVGAFTSCKKQLTMNK